MTSRPPVGSDHLSDLFFADLPLPHAVRAGISACGFVRATPVQAATLPMLLAGKDVAAQAQTGTGKTAAYLVAILARLTKHPRPVKPGAWPRALAVAPTRELAVQIQEDAKALSHFVKPRIVTVYGGIDYGKQRDQLRAGCDILIGTPGRLLDYEQQGATSFREVESLVVDEADRLFDLGFIKDLRRILRLCPPPHRRHSMLFSATLSYRVMELAYEHLNDAQKVEIRPEQVTADRVTQVLYHVSQREKVPLLMGILRREGAERTMLFVNTKRFAERLGATLERRGYKVGALTGDIPQAKRLKILSDFKTGKIPILIATDVASRGLHIDGVTHVVNVDLPQDPEDYVHRIGRTARAGRSGKAISLADEDFVFSLDAIQKLIGMKIPVQFADDALFDAAAPAPRAERSAAPPPVAPAPPPPPRAPGPVLVSEEEQEEEDAAAEVAVAPPPRPVPPPPSAPPPSLAAPKAAKAPPKAEPVAPPAPAPVPVPVAVAAPEPQHAPEAADEDAQEEAEAVPQDFWTREAFGLAPLPAGSTPPGDPLPASRRRRRRHRGGSARV